MAENGAPPDEAVMIVMSRKSLRSGNRLVTKATSSRFSAMCVCRVKSGYSRQSAPAASSCAGVLDPAQRGVMA